MLNKENKYNLLKGAIILFLLLFYLNCSSDINPNPPVIIPQKTTPENYLQLTYKSIVTSEGQSVSVKPILSDQPEIEISKYEISVLDKKGIDGAMPKGITIDSNTGIISIDSTTKATSHGLDLVVTVFYIDKETSEEKIAETTLRIFVVQNDKIIFKGDMHLNARKVLSVGDVDNEYLYRINNFTNADGVTGDIIIVNSNTGEEAYRGTGLKAVDSAVELDGNTEKVSFVGIGPSKDNPINMDQLADNFKMTVIVYKDGNEVSRLPDIELKKGTEGTMEGYKAIYTWRDLSKINDDLDGNYEMMNDISFPEQGTFGFSNFKPISHINDNPGSTPFTGVFDGQSHTISQLYIDYENVHFVGLFGVATDVTIRNLTIEHSGIRGYNSVGTLVGYIYGGIAKDKSLIENVHIKALGGKTVQGNEWVGGLIGSAAANWDNNLGHYIRKVSTHTPVFGNRVVGGIVGTTSFIGVEGYTTGNVYAVKKIAGGLVGRSATWPDSPMNQTKGSTTTIVGYSTGNVYTEGEGAGGLVGEGFKGISYVYGYSMGDIQGQKDVGGLIGRIGVNMFGDRYVSSSNIINIRGYATGGMGGKYGVGGLVGNIPSKEIDIVGYSRVKISSTENIGALFIGEVGGDTEDTTVEKNYRGYYSKDESKIESVGSDGKSVNGSPIDISEVTDANKETHFEGFTFGDAVGEWTWVKDGSWPAINIGFQAKEKQPVDGFSESSESVDLDFPSDLSGIQLISETGNIFTFKIAEMLNANIFRGKQLTGAWQFDKYPTGLFVPPGESIQVTLIENGEGDHVPNLMLGSYHIHSDSSYSGPRHENFIISDRITTIKNTSSFPRLLYLEFASYFNPDQIAIVKIEGAKKAPYFILGKTTSQEFRNQMNIFKGYDSMTMASDRFVYVMSRENMLKYIKQDWELLARRIDKIIEISSYNVNGLDGSTELHTEPPTRILISGNAGEGYMFSTPISGIAIQNKIAWQWIDVNSIDNNWGFWHELGHQLQPSSFWNDGTQEVYVNIYSLTIQRYFGQKNRIQNVWEDGKLHNYLTSDRDDKDYFNDLGEFERLALYEQLRLEFGDEFFPRIHKYIRENWREYPDRTSAEMKNQNFVKVTSLVSGMNLGNFFKTWGYDPSYAIFTNSIITQLPAPPSTLINQGFR